MKRVLGLWDLVLLNITAIVGLRWISLAAAGGNTSILLWGMALVFFFIPQAFAVSELTSKYPGEGGIYIWVKEAFGDFHGFLAGWCYWTNNLVYFPNLLVYIAGISVFTMGSGYEAVGESKLYILLFSLSTLWIVMLFNILGMKLGRWVNNIGGLGTWLTGSILILFGIIAVIKYGAANPMTGSSFIGGIFTFDKLKFWAAMCFGFSGLELASLLAGEVRDPARNIPRAIVLSGIAIAVIYILGTVALRIALPGEQISIISGFLQGVAAVGTKLGMGWSVNLLALLITMGGIGGLMAWFTAAARLPFVAGVDRYLPQGFGKLHPKYGSPYIAILIQGVIASLFILMSFAGSTVEQAYTILLDTTLLVYFLPYAYMFLAYVILRRRDGHPPGKLTLPKNNALAGLLGLSGLLTTLIAIALSVIPDPETGSPLIFELKVVGGFLLFVLAGSIIFKTRAVNVPVQKSDHE
ncbi:MAG: amino acid permease [FCB group bacterium]|nr:amino acid permease [FCB group bacterium]